MMGRRIPLANGDEQDVFTRWRHYLVCCKRPGYCAKVKRSYRRRERAVARAELRRGER